MAEPTAETDLHAEIERLRAQVAALTARAETAEALDRTLNLRGRLVRDNWVAAAKKLTEENASA